MGDLVSHKTLDNLKGNELAEVELDIENLNDGEMKLKKPKDVYYEIYRGALEKARQMKKAAIESYLEAKKIKTRYMLDDMLNSEDELSESSELGE